MSVCPSGWTSVCPFVCQTRELWQKRKKLLLTFLYIPHERSMHLVFRHEDWLMGDVTFYRKFWAKLTLSPLQKRRLQLIFAHSASAIVPSEKSSIITNRKSTNSYPMSLRWTAYVAHKPSTREEGAKKMAVFCIKVDFIRRKSVTKFPYCVKTFSDKAIRH